MSGHSALAGVDVREPLFWARSIRKCFAVDLDVARGVNPDIIGLLLRYILEEESNLPARFLHIDVLSDTA